MRFKGILCALLILLLALPAFGDQVTTATLNSTTSKTITVDTAGYSVATVTVLAASGTPDGTVQVYVDGKSLGTAAQYATPTTTKVFRGPVSGTLVVALGGNSTGTVSVTVRLK